MKTEQTRKVKRVLSLLLVLSMALTWIPGFGTAAHAADADGDILAVIAEAEPTVDGILSEKEWIRMSDIVSEDDGAPRGHIGATWLQDTMYLAVRYEDAAQLELTIEGKRLVVELPNGSAEANEMDATVAAGAGTVEIAVPFTAIGGQLLDYNQARSLSATLTNGAGGRAEYDQEVVFTGSLGYSQSFTPAGGWKSSAGAACAADSVTFDFSGSETANGRSYVLKSDIAEVNLGSDMILAQDLLVEAMPDSEGVITGISAQYKAEKCYFFYLVPVTPTGTPGPLLSAAVYKQSDENLYLKFGSADNSNQPIALGKGLNEKFRLAIVWQAQADGTYDAEVYVDGIYVGAQETASYQANQQLGQQAIVMNAYTTNNSDPVKLTASNMTLTTELYAAIGDELTVRNVLSGVNLDELTENLPTTFSSPYLGDVPLTWSSAPENVISSTGEVIRQNEETEVRLTCMVGEQKLWTVDATVPAAGGGEEPIKPIGPIEAGDVLAYIAETAPTVDGSLTEKEWIQAEPFSPEADGAPTGSIAAAWLQGTMYLAVRYENAAQLALTIEGRRLVVDLPNGSAGTNDMGAAVAAGNGAVEIAVPFTAVGGQLLDYGLSRAVTATLTNGTGSAAYAGHSIIFTGRKVNSQDLSNYVPSPSTLGGITVSGGSLAVDIAEGGNTGIRYAYRTGIALLDHDHDMVLTQDLQIDHMPVSTGEILNTSAASDCYYFYVPVTPASATAGPVLFGAIYRADEDGNLKLRFSKGSEAASAGLAPVDLGVKPGDSFRLAVVWKTDDSAEVYVDGILAGIREKITYEASGLGARTVTFRYNKVTANTSARLTVSNVTLSKEVYKSVKEELSVESVLGNLDLSHVTRDLDMPPIFESPYLGSIPLEWESSNPSVISNNGTVTPPADSSGADVTLTLKVGGEDFWRVNAHVESSPETILPSPAVVNTAYSASGITLDGSIGEEGWSMGSRVLTADGRQIGSFGAQWRTEGIYLAVNVRRAENLSITLNGKTSAVDLDSGAISGDFTGTAVVRYGVAEICIPYDAIGLTFNRYNTKVPITVTMGEGKFEGTLLLSSYDWFIAENSSHHLPTMTTGSRVLTGNGGTGTVTANQGARQTSDGWEFYDLYDEEGKNPTVTRTYVIFMGDDVYEPIGDGITDTYSEFDIEVRSMPVYSEELPNLGSSFASYGLTWGLAGKYDASKSSSTVIFGLFNTEKGLILVGTTEYGAVSAYLDKQVGDLFHLGTRWTTDGDVIVYIDGEEHVRFEKMAMRRKEYADRAISMNMIRSTEAARSHDDDMDIVISNMVIGKSAGDEVLRTLTFDMIRGGNTIPSEITSNLVLPNTIATPLPHDVETLTWATSDASIINVDGTVTRPETAGRAVTLTAMFESETKTFELYVPGRNAGSAVYSVALDKDPSTGRETEGGDVFFTLDENNNSVILDLGEAQEINTVVLHDSDAFARLNPRVLTLWVSDDNAAYTQVESFKLLHDGTDWYLYGFTARGRYVKVHCTHFDGAEADFKAPLQAMIEARYDTVFGDSGGEFASETTLTVTNASGFDRIDGAFRVSLVGTDVDSSNGYRDLRVLLDGELLYHYVDGDELVVRVPELASGGSVPVTVLSGNASALNIANRENVYEVVYGTQEGWLNDGNSRWITALPGGTLISMKSGGSGMMKSFSYNDGVTWTTPELVECTRNFLTDDGGFIIGGNSGRIFFEGHKYVGFNSGDMSKSDCKTGVIYSDDNGATWYSAGYVQANEGLEPTYALAYADGIELSTWDGDGPNVDFVFPVGAQYNNSGSFCARVAYSTNNGLTWKYSDSKITIGGESTFEGGVSEANIVELSSGDLLLIARRQAADSLTFARAISTDHGVTWQETADVSNIFTPNTQPIMKPYGDDLLLLWGGNNVVGGDSYRRTPMSIAISTDDGDHFGGIQDAFSKYSFQNLSSIARYMITNPSIALANDVLHSNFTYLTYSIGYTLRIVGFDDFMHKTKGAYDSFENGSVKYEGWSLTRGTTSVTDAQRTEGNYSLQIGSSSTVSRSIPYLQAGVVSMNVYAATGSENFLIDLQAAYNESTDGRSSALMLRSSGGELYTVTADGETAAGLSLRQGWNTIVMDLRLNEGEAAVSVNGSGPASMDINAAVADYVCFVTIFTESNATLYVDEFTVDAVTCNRMEETAGYTVTVKGTEGAFTAEGVPAGAVSSTEVTTVTITPAEHYEITGVAVTVGKESAGSTARNENGSWTVTIPGDGSVAGKVVITVTVTVTSETVEPTVAVTGTFTYNKSAHEPDPVVKVGEKTLVKDADYTVSYEDNVNAGTAKVKVTAKAGREYTWETPAEAAFTIDPAPLAVKGITQTITEGKALPGSLYTVEGLKGSDTLAPAPTVTHEIPNPTTAGIYTITVTGSAVSSDGNYSITYTDGTLTVEAAVAPTPVTGVTLNHSTLALIEGGTGTLTASVLPVSAANQTVTWTSSDPAVVTVSGGTVTALRAGTAVITVITVDGGFTAACTITVSAPSTPIYPVYPNYSDTGNANTDTPSDPSAVTGSPVVTPSTSVNNGTAVAEVSETMADQLVEQAASGTSTVVVAPVVAASASQTEVTIPASAISGIANGSNAELRVETPAADITIPNSALTDLGRQGGNVVITAGESNGIVSIEITANGKVVEQVPGGVKAEIPFSCTPGTVAMVIDENGDLTPVRKSYADDSGQTMNVPLEGSAQMVFVDNSKTFTDVPAANWASDAVAFASSRELMNGVGSNNFSPDTTMTRGMLAVVLHNLEGNPSAVYAGGFNDVSSSDWYAKAVQWAADNSIINGVGNSAFAPDAPITREQMVVMLYRYAGQPAASGSLGRFGDAGSVSGWAQQAMVWAVTNGIINGSNGALNPQGSATRAEVAQMLMNFITSGVL